MEDINGMHRGVPLALSHRDNSTATMQYICPVCRSVQEYTWVADMPVSPPMTTNTRFTLTLSLLHLMGFLGEKAIALWDRTNWLWLSHDGYGYAPNMQGLTRFLRIYLQESWHPAASNWVLYNNRHGPLYQVKKWSILPRWLRWIDRSHGTNQPSSQ